MISLLVQISVSLSLWIFLSRSSGRIEESVNVLKETAGKTMEAGFNFSKISGDLLGRGEVQAAAVEETTATLAEIAAMVTMSARNAKAAQTESEASFKSAELGQKSILELNASIKEVVLATKKIAEVTEAVDDIAFQINLLSLNASVEAARAGEQGRGFAVVAEGVRTLAFKSAQAAKDIEQIINQSTDKALHAQKSAETNTGILNELLISIEKVKQLNAEIAESSHEQALGVDSISKAMGEIDTKTNEAAMASREANDHAQDLTAESEKLGNVIQTFEDEILGKRSA
jgi:methyl-accepting chemotaxis protein